MLKECKNHRCFWLIQIAVRKYHKQSNLEVLRVQEQEWCWPENTAEGILFRHLEKSEPPIRNYKLIISYIHSQTRRNYANRFILLIYKAGYALESLRLWSIIRSIMAAELLDPIHILILCKCFLVQRLRMFSLKKGLGFKTQFVFPSHTYSNEFFWFFLLNNGKYLSHCEIYCSLQISDC